MRHEVKICSLVTWDDSCYSINVLFKESSTVPVNKECLHRKKTGKVGFWARGSWSNIQKKEEKGTKSPFCFGFFFFLVTFVFHYIFITLCVYNYFLLANDTGFLAEIFDYKINHWYSTVQMAPYIFYICICSTSVLITKKDRVIKAVKKLHEKKPKTKPKKSKERCWFFESVQIEGSRWNKCRKDHKFCFTRMDPMQIIGTNWMSQISFHSVWWVSPFPL